MAGIHIQDWMIQELTIRGEELIAFAVIHECTTKKKIGWYYGSGHLARRIGSTIERVSVILSDLLNRRLVSVSNIEIGGESRELITSLVNKNVPNSKKLGTFVSHYLKPRTDIPDKKVHAFCSRYILHGKDIPEGAKDYIRRMPYADFLKTVYWKGITLAKRKASGGKCQMCGSNINLEVHHTTYKNHGDELRNMGDLVCLCRKCHSFIHKTNKIR